MKKTIIASICFALSLAVVAAAQQTQPTDPAATPPRPRPRPTFAQQIKSNLQRIGGTVDDSKSSIEMVVSNYPDLKGGKTTVVITNDRKKGLVGFYIYNFGNMKNATNREEVFKYLLTTNDAITIGSFFVDQEDDIGYKYLVSNSQALSQAAFENAYLTMTAVAREKRPVIRKLLGLPVGGREEKPAEEKKTTEEERR